MLQIRCLIVFFFYFVIIIYLVIIFKKLNLIDCFYFWKKIYLQKWDNFVYGFFQVLCFCDVSYYGGGKIYKDDQKVCYGQVEYENVYKGLYMMVCVYDIVY